jgi:hypothetical protein
MPKSIIHENRRSYSAPVTQKVGAKQPQETLREFLARIKRTEKDIAVRPAQGKSLADLPPSQWAEYVVNLWEANT